MMRVLRGRLAVALVALVLGALVVAQARGQASGSGLEDRSAQDLTLLVANLTTRNDQLRGEVADLDRQLTSLQTSGSRGGTAAGQLRTDLVRVRTWAGLEAAEGPGVRVVVRGPAPAAAIGDLVNELRNGGAEALAVGGVRLVASSVVAGDAGALSVENTLLEDPIEIVAIGNSAALTGTLTRAGGIVAQVQATWPDIAVEVVPLQRLAVPATDQDLAPADARARP
jgi:uncharacterized protein YlxW (UPF0749 family)